MSQVKLPSWRSGTTRDALEVFLDAAEMLPVEQRVAVFDTDGTLWCEKPRPIGLEFLIGELRAAVAKQPGLTDRPEYRAVLEDDHRAVGQLGPLNVRLALTELHAGLTPEEFDSRARGFIDGWRHPQRTVPPSRLRYRPMLELIAELRARDFSVFLLSGVGSEFVRVVSRPFYGVEPECVLGTQVGYELDRIGRTPRLRRTRELVGDPNEGPARVASVQRLSGRRPVLAAGNSVGDWELLEYVAASEGPSLALLVEHDDAQREYAYESVLAAPGGAEPVAAAARRQGWPVISMRDDWATVFAAY